MEKTALGVLAVTATVAMAYSASIIVPNADTQAASVSECLSASGADQVASVQYACSACFSSSAGGARGTLWFNGSATNKNSDEVVSNTNASSIPLYMWGQVYSCRQSTRNSNTAMHIWLGGAGQMSNPKLTTEGGQQLTYIKVPNSLYRGTGTGNIHTWYSPSSNYGTGSIDVQGFIADADSHTTEQVNGVTYEIYKKTVSVNRCFNNTYGGYVYDGSVCYGDDSVITLRLENVPPPTEPEPESGSGDAHFYSTTTASVSGLSDGPSMSVTTDPDGYSEIKFSTDDEVVNIDFSHTMYYVNNGSYDPDDTFPTVSTNWTVTTNGSGSNGYSANGTYSTYGKYSSSSQVNANTVTVAMSPGETKTVCQINQYRPKYISFGRNDIGWWVYPLYGSPWWYHDYWQYFIEGTSGSNFSRACVEITRPADPVGTPTSSGTMYNTLMYTGETSEIGWSVSGTSYPTRRLAEWQAVVYQVPVTVGHYGGITDGDDRYRGGGACAYYRGKSSTRYCGIFNSQSGLIGFGANTRYHHATSPPVFSILVPDYVGDKYCNGFAYRYEYWYYTTDQGWQHYSSSDYWYVYNSTCRTIAKKPSTDIWNNSLRTDGGVQTSLSPRYQPANMGALVSGSPRLYGSWAEYLAVVNGAVDGYTSGSALALGSSLNNVYDNSPLTIANQGGSLGGSGVLTNSSQRTRLETYLKYNAAAYDITASTIGGGNWENVTSTQIVRRSGKLTINGDIKLNPGPYDNIYQLPQVVIFVDGDVEITGNVRQIDAWIIATGSIDTCVEFRDGVTQSDTSETWGDACTNQLVFNGPIMASNLILHRSFGSDPLVPSWINTGTFGAASDRQTPAEVFNYRADAYLWAYAQASRYDSSFTETYTRELAPRY